MVLPVFALAVLVGDEEASFLSAAGGGQSFAGGDVGGPEAVGSPVADGQENLDHR